MRQITIKMNMKEIATICAGLASLVTDIESREIEISDKIRMALDIKKLIEKLAKHSGVKIKKDEFVEELINETQMAG